MSDHEPGVVEPLPAGHVLLHIGPHKTGTTAVQHSLTHARTALLDHGAGYPPYGVQTGPPSFHHRAALQGWAVMGWAPFGLDVPEISAWDDFAAEVRRLSDAGNRVCVSTEDFCQVGSRESAQRIVEDLGGERVHVVIGCRSLGKVLPSNWQQRIRNGVSSQPYEDFLRESVSERPEEAADDRLWRYQGFDWVFEHWLSVVGPERFTVMVLEGGGHDMILRTFERLLDVPNGLLATPERQEENVSVPFEQAEFLRHLNTEATQREWPHRDYVHFLRSALLPAMAAVTPRPGGTLPPPMPDWVVDLLPRLERRRVDTLTESGVRVIGDPAALVAGAESLADQPDRALGAVDTGVMVAAAASLLDRTLEFRASRDRARRKVARMEAARALDRVSSKQMLREVVRRQRARLRRGNV